MRRLFPALLALPLLALAPPRLLAESEVYGGVGIGYSTFSQDAPKLEGAAVATREFLGLRYGDYVALELGFIDFGTVNNRVRVAFGQPSQNLGVETWGYDVSLLGRYPLSQELAVFGKVGTLRWDSDQRLGGLRPVTRLSGDDLIWGLGVDFRSTGRFHVRMEAEFVNIEFANSWWVLSTSVMYGIPFAR